MKVDRAWFPRLTGKLQCDESSPDFHVMKHLETLLPICYSAATSRRPPLRRTPSLPRRALCCAPSPALGFPPRPSLMTASALSTSERSPTWAMAPTAATSRLSPPQLPAQQETLAFTFRNHSPRAERPRRRSLGRSRSLQPGAGPPRRQGLQSLIHPPHTRYTPHTLLILGTPLIHPSYTPHTPLIHSHTLLIPPCHMTCQALCSGEPDPAVIHRVL
jgi:hypothetical protein